MRRQKIYTEFESPSTIIFDKFHESFAIKGICHKTKISVITYRDEYILCISKYLMIIEQYLYRATILEMDNPFIELASDSFSDICASIAFLAKENAGFLGKGSGKLSFVNIEMTSDIVGRSIGLSSTHRRPT